MHIFDGCERETYNQLVLETSQELNTATHSNMKIQTSFEKPLLLYSIDVINNCIHRRDGDVRRSRLKGTVICLCCQLMSTTWHLLFENGSLLPLQRAIAFIYGTMSHKPTFLSDCESLREFRHFGRRHHYNCYVVTASKRNEKRPSTEAIQRYVRETVSTGNVSSFWKPVLACEVQGCRRVRISSAEKHDQAVRDTIRW